MSLWYEETHHNDIPNKNIVSHSQFWTNFMLFVIIDKMDEIWCWNSTETKTKDMTCLPYQVLFFHFDTNQSTYYWNFLSKKNRFCNYNFHTYHSSILPECFLQQYQSRLATNLILATLE